MSVVIEKKNLNLAEMKRLVSGWLKSWKTPRNLVLLEGPMGVGKTQFLRLCLEQKNVKDLASPTFAVHHVYESDQGEIDHFDLYRLESDEDLESTGFWDVFAKPEGSVFIEWADRLPLSSYPRNWRIWRVQLAFASHPDLRNLRIEE